MIKSIHPDTRLGCVHLTVRDLKRSLSYYQDVLGFKLHRRTNGTAYLGAGSSDILVLTENPEARPLTFSTGLYHFAVLVPSRLELARVLQSLADHDAPPSGFADHLVSEAIYLNDPDGNGIEVYRDRPRSQWYDARGRFRMGTEPLDLRGIMSELEGVTEPWTGLAPGTTLGHMHLKVANIARDEAFYHDLLGFDLMVHWHSASFLSAGGYHHHLGMNTWESAGAPPPPPDSIGLQYFTVILPNREQLTQIADRVAAAELPIEETPLGLAVRDPSQNQVILTTGGDG